MLHSHQCVFHLGEKEYACQDAFDNVVNEDDDDDGDDGYYC